MLIILLSQSSRTKNIPGRHHENLVCLRDLYDLGNSSAHTTT